MQDFPDKSPPALKPSPDGRGTLKVSIYPKVSGSISDAQVQAEPETPSGGGNGGGGGGDNGNGELEE